MSSEITLASGSVTALTALANGTFLTVWNGAGNVPTAQIYHFDGTKKGAPIQLASGSTGENLNFTATSLSDGRFVVVWQQKDAQDGVYARVFDVNGIPTGDAFKIASGATAQTSPQLQLWRMAVSSSCRSTMERRPRSRLLRMEAKGLRTLSRRTH